jgi:ketosteroid isomerase-like protein
MERGGAGFLYLALACAGGLLTFAGTRAQQRASDDATFRRLIDSYCAAWSSGTAEAPAKFYAKDNGLVFYDLAPFSYHSWKEYHDGVQKVLFTNMESGSLTADNDLKVTRRGTLAWTTVSMHFSEKTKDGKAVETQVRYTGIWRSAVETALSCMSTSQSRWEASRLEEVQAPSLYTYLRCGRC